MSATEVLRESNRSVRDPCPTQLGKFLDAKGVLASLEEFTIRFTPPSQLNDEWDCIPFQYQEKDIENAWRHSPLYRLCPEQKQ